MQETRGAVRDVVEKLLQGFRIVSVFPFERITKANGVQKWLFVGLEYPQAVIEEGGPRFMKLWYELDVGVDCCAFEYHTQEAAKKILAHNLRDAKGLDATCREFIIEQALQRMMFDTLRRQIKRACVRLARVVRRTGMGLDEKLASILERLIAKGE